LREFLLKKSHIQIQAIFTRPVSDVHVPKIGLFWLYILNKDDIEICFMYLQVFNSIMGKALPLKYSYL